MKRYITLDIGFSPGDIVVFTRALEDLCKQYPDFDIEVKSPCQQIFENNPYINKKHTPDEPKVSPCPDNLKKIGYDIDRIARDSQGIWKEMLSDRSLAVVKDEHSDTYYYKKIDTDLDLFYVKCKNQPHKDREFYQVHYEDIHSSGWSGRHFSNAFYIELEELLKVPIKQTSLLPALFLSDEEKGWINQVEQEFDYRGKFWLINAGHKDDYPLKQWGFENWQWLVSMLKDKIQFVQVGEKAPKHHHPELEGVFSLVGKTDLRELVRLSYHAQGMVSHVSLLHHLAAAWQKPCITIAGGREPRRWESYPHMRYLDTNGCLPCASYDGCWLSGKVEGKENKTCKNLVGGKTKCMQMIKPERVAEEVLNYYTGGMLCF